MQMKPSLCPFGLG